MHQAANDDLSPFEAWWVGQGGNPDLSAWEATFTISYDPASPTGNRGTWQALPGYVAPSLQRACFNRDPRLTLAPSQDAALVDLAVLWFRYSGAAFPYRTFATLPEPQEVTWSGDELDILWNAWAQDQTAAVAQYRQRFPDEPQGPRNPQERLHQIAHAAWERFRQLPQVVAHPCSEADYWALVQDRTPGLDRVEDRYAARYAPPSGTVIPFRRPRPR